jgi:putative flippase GtrA
MEHQETPTRRPLTFIWVGVVLSAANFLIYILLTHTFLRDESAIPAASAVAYVLSAVIAYLMHKSITWKDRAPSKATTIKFFVTNLIVGFVLTPVISWIFLSLTGIYEFAFAISSFLHLPFSLDLITKIGVWGFTNAITMTINYIVYNKIVFREKK